MLWKDVKEYNDEFSIVYHISPKLGHIVIKKGFMDWFWKKVYSYFNSIKIIDITDETPMTYNIIENMCTKGWASHIIKWDYDHYVVDLTTISVYSGKYGCLLKLNQNFEPIEMKCGNLTLYDCKSEFVIHKFISSLLVKTLLIDNVLMNRFLFCDNLAISIKKFPHLPIDLKKFLLPFTFNIINANQFIYDYYMPSHGIFKDILDFPNYHEYMSNEYDFCIPSTPREMYELNNLKFAPNVPIWYHDAMIYWDIVETFVNKWVNIFLNKISFQEIAVTEEWLTSLTGIFLELKPALIDILTKIIWNITFFQHFIEIKKFYTNIPTLRQGLIYYSSMNKFISPFIIGDLWKTQDPCMKDIFIEFSTVLESLEFKSLGIQGGELQTCF
jgi:hypothetical protein